MEAKSRRTTDPTVGSRERQRLDHCTDICDTAKKKPAGLSQSGFEIVAVLAELVTRPQADQIGVDCNHILAPIRIGVNATPHCGVNLAPSGGSRIHDAFFLHARATPVTVIAHVCNTPRNPGDESGACSRVVRHRRRRREASGSVAFGCIAHFYARCECIERGPRAHSRRRGAARLSRQPARAEPDHCAIPISSAWSAPTCNSRSTPNAWPCSPQRCSRTGFNACCSMPRMPSATWALSSSACSSIAFARSS